MEWLAVVAVLIGLLGAYQVGRIHGSRARQRAYMQERTVSPARFVRRESVRRSRDGPSPKFARERREATEAHISQPRPDWSREV